MKLHREGSRPKPAEGQTRRYGRRKFVVVSAQMPGHWLRVFSDNGATDLKTTAVVQASRLAYDWVDVRDESADVSNLKEATDE